MRNWTARYCVQGGDEVKEVGPIANWICCYGVDIMGGSTPQVGQRTQLGAQNVVEAKQNIYYIIHDNRHIYTPVYPTPRVQDNQPRQYNIYII